VKQLFEFHQTHLPDRDSRAKRARTHVRAQMHVLKYLEHIFNAQNSTSSMARF
jgi:hypothetical protein